MIIRVISAILEALENIIPVVIGLGVLALLVYLLWPFRGIVLKILSIALIVLIIFGVIVACYRLVRAAGIRKQGATYLTWLSSVGIGTLWASEEVLDWVRKNGDIVFLPNDYAMANTFYYGVLNVVERKQVATIVDLQDICKSCVASFCADYLPMLTTYAKQNDHIFLVDEYYLSLGFICGCEKLFHEKGRETEMEFANRCDAVLSNTPLQGEGFDVAHLVLVRMQEEGDIKVACKLEEGFLYESTHLNPDATKNDIEISLD